MFWLQGLADFSRVGSAERNSATNTLKRLHQPLYTYIYQRERRFLALGTCLPKNVLED